MIKLTKLTSLLAAATLIFTGCGNDEPTVKKEKVADNTLLPDTIMLSTKPAESIAISEAKKRVASGGAVTIFGQVGGVVAPFVDKRATMVIADHTKMKACGVTCKGCKTPWDFCCEPPEVRQKHTVTVQFVDQNGKVVRQGLENFHGIKKNSKVIVTGKYAPNSTSDFVIINAEKIYLDK